MERDRKKEKRKVKGSEGAGGKKGVPGAALPLGPGVAGAMPVSKPTPPPKARVQRAHDLARLWPGPSSIVDWRLSREAARHFLQHKRRG